LPYQIKEKLDDYSKCWIGKLPFKKWTYMDDFHITLSFLGPVTDQKINELITKLHEELKNANHFHLTLDNLGVFGNKFQPRVWWCGVENSNELRQLQRQISVVCEEIGFNVEKRPYRPHITIAKKSIDQIDEYNEIPVQWNGCGIEFDVEYVTVYKIHPNKKPSYEVVDNIKLS
jgi:2'-5' RNA ligase